MIVLRTAVSAIGRARRRSAVGLRSKNRTIVNVLFCGPTGTDKTEIAKALGSFFFRREASLVRIDMAEYSLKESTTKMIGVSAGFEG